MWVEMVNKENFKLITDKVSEQELQILNIKFLIQVLNDAIKGNEGLCYLEPLTTFIADKIENLYEDNQNLHTMCLISRD